MYAFRFFSELGSNIVTVFFHVIANGGYSFKNFLRNFMRAGLGLTMRDSSFRFAAGSGNIRRHHRLRDRGVPTMRAIDFTLFRLHVIGRTVTKPGFEFVTI